MADENAPPLADSLRQVVDLVVSRLEKTLASGPPDTTLAHLRALRREFQTSNESQQIMMRSITRIDRDIAEMRADIHSLENSALNRHNELLAVMRKVEHIDDA